MGQIDIPRQIIAEYSAALLPVDWQMPNSLEESPSSIRQCLENLMMSISDDLVRDRVNNPHFQFFHKDSAHSSQEAAARREILCHEITFQINEERIRLLRQSPADSRPAPYNHPSLLDLTITDDNLVELKDFPCSEARSRPERVRL